MVEEAPPALPPKPKPRLAIPTFTMTSPKSPTASTIGPAMMASGCAVPIGNVNGPFGMFQNMYPTKATEFMCKRYATAKDFTKNTAKAGLSFGEKWSVVCYDRIRTLSRRWFTHIFLMLVVILYSLLGAMLFVTFEGNQEDKERIDMAESLRLAAMKMRKMAENGTLLVNYTSWQNGVEEDLKPYQLQLEKSWLHGVSSNPVKRWTFWNSVFYCGTIYTTIGYGHISPVTATGRAITVVYAIIGIPMFLILLADFGKLFTRAIKFLWAFVRRLYYTGSCRKVRGTVPVQDMVKGVQAMYDFARRSSQMPGTEPQTDTLKPPESSPEIPPETPAPSQFEIDDEFNLPISVAITILVAYILIGATIYSIWEEWSFFECFYFVFISMSTIGFGDFVPNHPMYMMASMVYLVFGLALTSMCINVVQEKLSDTFKQASAKIGATIGFDVDEEGMPEQEATESQAQPEEV